MSGRTSSDAFVDAVSAMVRDDHVVDILARLVHDCVRVLRAQSVAILVMDGRDRLSLLSSSSAQATQLEMLQAQDRRGPCVDVIRTGGVVSAGDPEEMVRRWGEVGGAIAQAGLRSVDAYPLMWHGRVLGGLNVFGARAVGTPDQARRLAQAFADVATIVLVHSSALPADQVTARVHEAVMARAQVEQAKGVLSEVEDLDMEEADARLREIAAAEGVPVTEAAVGVVERAHRHL